MNKIDEALSKLEKHFANGKPINSENPTMTSNRKRLVDYKGECRETTKA